MHNTTRRVVIESPYAGDVDKNTSYAKACMLDAIKRGEAPLAGHLLYTQILDDSDPGEREQGIACHLAWISGCHAVIVYTDLGISPGMQLAIDEAKANHTRIEHRTLCGWPKQSTPEP